MKKFKLKKPPAQLQNNDAISDSSEAGCRATFEQKVARELAKVLRKRSAFSSGNLQTHIWA